MKLIGFLFLLLALALGLAVLVPLLGLAALATFPLVALVIWFLPILIIAVSDKTTAGEKLAWILAIVFLSWFAWIFYFLLAPIKKTAPRHCRYEYRSYPEREYRYRH